MTSQNTSYIAQWMAQMRRGWLETCLLNVLAGEELHGYGLMLRLQDIPGWAFPRAASTPCSPACACRGSWLSGASKNPPTAPPARSTA